MNQFGKYKDPWKSGMGISDIMAAWEDSHGKTSSSSVVQEESIFDEDGLPKRK